MGCPGGAEEAAPLVGLGVEEPHLRQQLRWPLATQRWDFEQLADPACPIALIQEQQALL